MRRIVPILLTALLLTACTKAPAATESVTTDVPEITQPIKLVSGGAVAVFPLEGSHYTDMALMGDKLVLYADQNELAVLQSTDCSVAAQVETEIKIDFSAPYFGTSPTGIGFFSQNSEEVILLNPNLQVTGRIPLPENSAGVPAVSLKNQEIYYVSRQEIRALDIYSGISRLVKSQSCKGQSITGSYFDGDILGIQVTDLQDKVTTQYIETSSGRTVSEDEGVYALITGGNQYFAFRLDGLVPQQIFGDRNGAANGFIPKENLYPVPVMAGAVTAQKTGSGLKLDFYDLNKQLRTSETLLPDACEPIRITAGAGAVWILAQNQEGNEQTIYRWDVSKSPVSDHTPCTEPLYSAENVDTAGLEQCRKRAKDMGKQYGVKIYLADEAVKKGKNLRQEYQIPTIQRMLDELEQALSLFPDRFLDRSIQGGAMKIGLVRKIDNGSPYSQFYQDGDCWILLSLDSDIPKDFIWAAGYAVDSHVLGNSRKYDTWTEMNPEGFEYDYDFEASRQRTDISMTSGTNRAFADMLSMSFPYVERSRLFYYAMTEEGKDMFSAPVMQQKLEVMCRAIREAYGYERKTDVYPWEQYLEESIAYSK